MNEELQKLRLSKDQKARREPARISPWLWLILLLLAIGGGVAFWQRGASAVPVKTLKVRPPDVSSSTGPSGSGSDQVILNATGYIIAAHKIELASKVVGRVAWVGVEMGDKITKGQVLVRLEDDEFKVHVTQQQGLLDNAKAKLAELKAGSRAEEIGEARADLDQAKAQLANAESNLQRLKDLERGQIVSKQEFDDAETLVRSRKAQVDARQQRLDMWIAGPRKEQIDAQQATVEQLQGALDQVKLDQDNTIIRAPVDATVLSRNVEVGEFVTTGFVGDRGAKGFVLSIADLNDLRVDLDISQNDFSRVRDEQPCWVTTDAYPDRKYAGIVDLISPEANRQKATVQVRVKVLHPDELLKPDMNATVGFLASSSGSSTGPSSGSARPPLRIPAMAVRDGAVFVVEDGRAVRRAVTTGQAFAGGEIEIKKGLIGGEDLIVSPPATLKDGDRIDAKENGT